MQTSSKALFILGFLAVLPLAWSTEALAQAQSTGSTNDSAYSAGVFLGFTDRNSADFTFGGELEFRSNSQWSYGALVEHTRNVVGSRGATALLATANYRPEDLSRLKLTGGAGVEFRDYAGDQARFRIGAGYDLFVDGPFTVTPRIAFDFGGGRDSIVLGATAFRHF